MHYERGFLLSPKAEKKKWGGVPSLCIKAVAALVISHTISLVALDLFSLGWFSFLIINLLALSFTFYKMAQMKNIASLVLFAVFLITIFGLKYYIDYAPEII